ncbi:MAG: hypothetical protein ABJQ69_03595 [Ekhidna sp.]
MFIGYQDVDLKVYDDQSDDFYDYLDDGESEEDEFVGRFVKRQLRNRKKLVKNTLFGLGGVGVVPKLGYTAIKETSRSIRRNKRRKRKSRRKASITAKRRMREFKKRYQQKNASLSKKSARPTPVLNVPISKKLVTHRRAVPKASGFNAQVPKTSTRPSASSVSQRLSTSPEAFDLGKKEGIDAPKQAGMNKNIIWVVVIVGGLIVATKVFTGKKTSDIVKVKQAA